MRKKISVLFLVALMLFAMAGCSGGTASSTAKSTAAKSTAGTSQSQTKTTAKYPTKSVQCIMAAAAGGGTDLQIRAISPFFSKQFGQELVPTAMPGGSGTIGMTNLANSAPDGYTIGVPYTGGVSIMPGYGQTSYKASSFRYICQYSNSPIVMAVNAKGNIKTAEDLIAYGKTHTILYSCAANGAIDLAIQAFAYKLGITMTNVPVEGATPAITNVLGNQVMVAGVHPTNIYSYIESGDLLPLVIFNEQRYEKLPDAKTAKELGVDVTVSVWNGLAVPANTPDDVYNTLVDGFAKIFADKECISAIEAIGSTVDYLPPAELQSKIEKEAAMFADLIANSPATSASTSKK